ncbi:hypothetical protein LguiB_021079 [Lonicera macranthoides]
MAAAAMALTFASLASLRLLKRASRGMASTSSESRNAGVTNTSSPTPSCLFSLSPFLSSPQQCVSLLPNGGDIPSPGRPWACESKGLAPFHIRLSVIVLKDPEAALRATILSCFNPASIFYSSIYSESLYSLLSIGGLYHLMSGKSNYATLWLALSGSTSCMMDNILPLPLFIAVVQVLIAGALRSICVFVPFIAFQAYGYYNICLGRSVEETRPWCKARIPLLYNFIQSHYWYVGIFFAWSVSFSVF